ncbi:MAG: putative F420-dependent oxidoreductase, partial [Pseudonocardiales bacterium]|nr:putative F420-dependent oxidoreductase [Pseudonocardiales bacterium]
DLVFIEQLLEATENIVVGTSIVNAWQYRADAVAAAYHRVAARFPGRLLLGIGIGHPEFDRPYQRPYDSVVAYLDGLDEAGVPVSDRILAALGPRMLDLAAERCVGAHPYLITPEHTDQARKRLGAAAVLAPEQKVVLDADPAQARAAARATVVDPYFKLSNYRANLREFGFSDDDMAAEGSDRVIDALVAWGDVDIVAGRLGAHLAAGAHHVAVQVLTGPDADLVTAYRRLADALFS